MESENKHLSSDNPYVVLTKCESYQREEVDHAVRTAIEQAGGIECIVKPNERVLLKPNLVSPRQPDAAVTTHPEVVAAMVRICLEAGAAIVWVGDSCAGKHEDRKLWEKTGMQKAVTEAGGVMRSFHAEGVKPLVCDNETVPIPAWWDEVDCFISIPKLKTHALTSLTCAVKNTYGVVVGLAKAALHAKYPSPNAMSRFLAAIHKALTPRFVLVDGIWAMEGEGPTNGRPKKVGILAASEEAVAVDAVLARLLRGENPKQMALLQAAADGQPEMIEEGNIQLVGDVVPEDLNVTMKPSLGRWLRRIPEPVFIVATRLVACRPVVVQSECKKCGACEQICSKKAVYRDESGAFHVDRAKCIVCMCCMETCPYAAIRIQNPISRVGNMCKRLIGKA